MGIYLAIYALSDGTIEQLHANPPLAWRVMDPELPEREAKARADRQPRPGLFARLFKGAKGEPPLNFLMGGGRSADTRRIADALMQLSDEEVRRRANPAEIGRLDLYPGVWDKPEDLGYLLEDLRRLRETVSEVAGRGLGLLVSIS